MKAIFLIAIAVGLTACASSEKPVLKSKNPDTLHVGESAPEGYPKTYLVVDRGTCKSITEYWQKDQLQGSTFWHKNKRIETVTCPTNQ